MSMPLLVGFVVAAASLMADGHIETVTDSCLLQRETKAFSHRTLLHLQDESCAPLKNQGTYFSVEVCVGTPKQCFDVVADTGSDSVIVTDCICAETPGSRCTQGEKCFRGTNASSTFSIPPNPKVIAMSFGSGTIEAAIATDVVSVANLKVKMDDGVLLMTSRAALRIAGEFQGILGLGIPKDHDAMPYLLQGPLDIEAADPHQPNPMQIICAMMPMLCGHGGRRPGEPTDTVPAPPPHRQREGGGIVGEAYESKLFLQQAKVDRFSMCFRDGNQSGALRFDLPPFASPIQNIGMLHWGLDFRGLSVGPHDAPAPAETIFCGPETMGPGMASPCGIIPDSGTTLLMGPKEQVVALETSICSKWERCQNRSQGTPSSPVFRKLLEECADWLTVDKGLLEIPSFFFHVQNGVGKIEAFELTAWAWVTEYTVLDAGSTKKVCTPSIGPMEYRTQKNGPIWIFGTPLFYEYDVGYDMATKQMSLQTGKCEPCSEAGGPVALTDNAMRRWPRAEHGEPRIPYYNVDLPL